MKKSALIAITGVLFLSGLLIPESGFCKKGGIGSGGGYEDGVLYHSHSDRSFSGRDIAKGKGKGHYKGKTKKKSSKGKRKALGRDKWDNAS